MTNEWFFGVCDRFRATVHGRPGEGDTVRLTNLSRQFAFFVPPSFS
jgi:hypothetical protein